MVASGRINSQTEIRLQLFELVSLFVFVYSLKGERKRLGPDFSPIGKTFDSMYIFLFHFCHVLIDKMRL